MQVETVTGHFQIFFEETFSFLPSFPNICTEKLLMGKIVTGKIIPGKATEIDIYCASCVDFAGELHTRGQIINNIGI